MAFPLIASDHCRKASKSYLQWLPTANIKSHSVSGTVSECLESVSESVKLNRLSGPDTGIIELKLDRPSAKIAIGKDMLRGLQATFEKIQNDHSARVLLISSSVPTVFCAGADLKERRAMSGSEVHSFVNSLRSTFAHLEELHIATIAVIEGAALGGGVELALSCDIRISGEDAILGLPETGLAIIPGAGGTQKLPRLVGKSVAKELIFTGRKVSGKNALSLALQGWLTTVFPLVRHFGRDLKLQGRSAKRMAKLAINKGMETDINSAWTVEEECYKQTLNTKDRLEGLTAFAEKRKPRYTGE